MMKMQTMGILAAAPAAKRAAGVLAARLEARGVTTGGGSFTLSFEITEGLSEGAFEIADAPGGAAVRASGLIGLMHGAGEFLRQSVFTREGMEPCCWRGSMKPYCSVRGAYFANHFHNFYHMADSAELIRYIEDLALWGFNYIMFTIPRIDMDNENCPEKVPHIRRIAEISKAVHGAGMRLATSLSCNDVYKEYPPELAIVPHADPLGRRGNSGNMICISKPGGQQLMDRINRDYLQTLKEFGAEVDLLITWPYDEGGCACPDCYPWGSNGFIRASKRAFEIGAEYYPDAVRCISTWMFDTPEEGEWEALSESLGQERWCDYILADAHEDYPRYPLDRGVPGGLPLLNFPEISMWGLSPWGGWGATMLPARFTRLWEQTEGKLDGGFLYSEGIYEDINKALVARLYFTGMSDPEGTLAQYARAELGMEDAGDFILLVHLMEKTHTAAAGGVYDTATAAEVFALAQKIDKTLPDFAKTCWRWRIVYLRALLENSRCAAAAANGSPRHPDYRALLAGDEAAKEAMREVGRIFHCIADLQDDPYHDRVRPLIL